MISSYKLVQGEKQAPPLVAGPPGLGERQLDGAVRVCSPCPPKGEEASNSSDASFLAFNFKVFLLVLF